jgi:hypothetical protein
MVNVSYSVSTAINEFVVLIPESQYLGQPNTAFNYYVLREMKPEDHSYHRCSSTIPNPMSMVPSLLIILLTDHSTCMQN